MIFRKTKVTDIEPGDTVLRLPPDFPEAETRIVCRVGWYYSAWVDAEYYRIDFVGGTRHMSATGQDYILANVAEEL